MHDAVDRMQAPWRAALERSIPGCQAVPFPEPEEADHAVYVEKEEGLLSFFRHEKV